MLKAVIFDMDGVLVDTEPIFDLHHISYSKKRFNISLHKNFLETTRGLSSQSFWEKLFTEFNITHSIEEVVEHARADYLEFLKEHPDLKPIEGVVELIEELDKAKIPLALASSASMKRINFILELLDIRNKFKAVVCSDDVQRGKPAPDIYLKAAETLGVNPKNCVAIEDAANGVKSAKKAGMRVIAYAGSPHNTQDLSEADLIIKDFKELNLEKLNTL